MAVRKDIKYVNKDFTGLRNQLINYSRTYFPDTYTDFSNTSPGMMFIEQAAYIGDVLSFYNILDNKAIYLIWLICTVINLRLLV